MMVNDLRVQKFKRRKKGSNRPRREARFALSPAAGGNLSLLNENYSAW